MRMWIRSKEDACVSHRTHHRSLGAVLTILIGTQLYAGAISFVASGKKVPPVWDIAGLKQTAVVSFPVEQAVLDMLNPQPPSGIRSFYINGIPYKGKETRLFCYYGIPSGVPPSGGWPGIVLVHGAGGTADALWVKWWNDKGYAALALDTAFRLPTVSRWRLREKTALPGPIFPWGTDPAWNNSQAAPEDHWLYHAVADVILAHNFFRQQPEVAPENIGIAGVSWGGIIISHVIGLDDRFLFAIPIYGCGFLHESDGLQSTTFIPNPEWDPSVNLGNANLPVFWTAGTTDEHFSPADRFKSKTLSMGKNKEASRWINSYWFMLPVIQHSLGANYLDSVFPEKINYVRFANAVVAASKTTEPGNLNLLRWVKQELTDTVAHLEYTAARPVAGATLFYTTDSGYWRERQWQSTAVAVNKETHTIIAAIPPAVTAYFLNVTEGSGSSAFTISSDLFLQNDMKR